MNNTSRAPGRRCPVVRKAIISVDIGATRTRIGIYDYNRMELLKRAEFATNDPEESRGIVERIIARTREILEVLEEIKPIAIGVGTIGPLDLEKGMVVSSPNVTEKTFEIKGPLELFFGIPTFVLNDCVAAAYGELMGGYGKGKKNIVYVTLSTGIGAGVVVDGELLLGKDGNAHEIGHLVLSYGSDIQCGCGGFGHWEGLSSGKNLWKLVEKLKRDYSGKTQLSSSESVSPENLFALWRKGDQLASIIIDELSMINAAGIASVINAYDPELLVLGGSIALKNQDFVRQFLEMVPRYTINRLPDFKLAYYGEDSVLAGAAWIARKPPKKLLETMI
ncbi:MAG TPA: ROK family protein [Fervidicoccus fontis]|uniref:ROK family protein n=1 Tax=Fervidicoccus fontis TaxID=683846 RepID=A0A7C2YH82_9CREN|nr:ROK family protein [Fervidicoccus fontis]